LHLILAKIQYFYKNVKEVEYRGPISLKAFETLAIISDTGAYLYRDMFKELVEY